MAAPRFLLALAVVAAVLVARPLRVSAECGPAPPGAAYFVTDRDRVEGTQFFGGERALSPQRDAVSTRGVLAGDTIRPCSSEAALFAALGKSLAAPGRRRLLLYVHGYYTSFRQAIDDGRAIAKGLAFAGPLLVYSWPSKKTSRLAYVKDEANAGWSLSHFRRLANSLVERFPDLPIFVASHSLGSRFAVDAIETLRRGRCGTCFRSAAFFAPDIDADTLHAALADASLCRGRPAENPATAAKVTVYVSNRDRALRESQRLHGFERAGQAGNEIVLCGGVDTIDVSYHAIADKAGHGYHTDTRVLADARAAFGGVPPGPRRKLTIARRPRGRYYELTP